MVGRKWGRRSGDAIRKGGAEKSAAYSSSPLIFLLSLNMIVRSVNYLNNIYSWIP